MNWFPDVWIVIHTSFFEEWTISSPNEWTNPMPPPPPSRSDNLVRYTLFPPLTCRHRRRCWSCVRGVKRDGFSTYYVFLIDSDTVTSSNSPLELPPCCDSDCCAAAIFPHSFSCTELDLEWIFQSLLRGLEQLVARWGITCTAPQRIVTSILNQICMWRIDRLTDLILKMNVPHNWP